MSEFMRRLSESNSLSEEKKTHWPEEVEKGKTYYIQGLPYAPANGLATFLGWEISAGVPVMKWKVKGGETWTAVMYEGEMRTEYRNMRFTIGYED